MVQQNSSKTRHKLIIFSRFIIISVLCLIWSVLAHANESSETTTTTTEPNWLIDGKTNRKTNLYCTDDEHNKTCCYDDEFQCSNGYCIPENYLCDDVMNCADNSDEQRCSDSKCKDRKIMKCDHLCLDLPNNHSKCTCHKGYAVKTSVTKTYSCQDVNECEIGVHTCTQNCENLNGTYKCTCKEGFYEKLGLHTGVCKAIDDNVNILYSSDTWIYSYSKKNSTVTPVIHAGKVDEMDYDPANDMIYWSTRHKVARSYLPGAKGGKVTVGHPQSVGPASIWHIKNSLAIDWSAGNIYWISIDILSVERYQILVSKLDGRYLKTLVDNVSYASSLVVDPEYGKMYWTSGGENAEIGASWMNGMYRRSLLRLTTRSPIALTLDHMANGKLYWADSKANAIYSMFTDGTRPTEIIQTGEQNRPLMMDVFENNLYWVTKDSNHLVMQDKFGRGHAVVLVRYLINQTAVKVHHKDRVQVDIRKAGLYCRTQCSHLCLHVPRGYSCSCPDGARLLLLLGEILCDSGREDPLEDPLVCDCTNKEEVCNTTAPFHKCYCPHVNCGEPEPTTENYDDYSLSTYTYSQGDFEEIDHPYMYDSHSPHGFANFKRALILLACIIPVCICFALSFCKRPERTSSPNARSDGGFNNPIGFSNQDNLLDESYSQGGPTIVIKPGLSTRNNGIDNPL